jgi:hypothetical protein
MPSPSSDDLSRHAATSPDDYSLTVEDALVRYEHAGHPRTPRTIQRYCAHNHLDCLRKETTFGDKYMITPASVARHLAQIEELASTTGRDASRPVATLSTPQLPPDNQRHDSATPSDQPRLVAAGVAHEQSHNDRTHETPAGPDLSRQVAAGPDLSERYIHRLEGEVTFLRDEVATKNAQIRELTERSRETNTLIGGLQRIIAPLLGSPDPYPRRDENPAA